MLSTYSIEFEQLIPVSKEKANILVYSLLTIEERKYLIDQFFIDPLDLDAINDPDEVPRIESSSDSFLIIWKRPNNVSIGDTIQFEVSSLGLYIGMGKVIVILNSGELQLSSREFKRVSSIENFALRVLLYTVHHYQGHLKIIKMISTELQQKIVASMENKYLLQMFTLSESLVYYYNALEANGTLLARLRVLFDKSPINNSHISFLEDVIIENQQAAKQANIYSTVLSGLMDARGTIVNNNMNSLLKNLTVINVVFLPLNLIASIGGMSEYSFFTKHIDWRISYAAFTIAMISIGWFTWWWLVKIIDHKHDSIKVKNNIFVH